MSFLTLITPAFIVLILTQLLRLSVKRMATSDNAVHRYYIDVIRERGHRLPIRLPNVLNQVFICDPLYMHLALSYLSKNQVEQVSRFFNSIVMVLQFVGISIITQKTLIPSLDTIQSLILVTALSLTPQYYVWTNARSLGISSRALGIFLFASLILSQYLVREEPFVYQAIPIFVAFLIWGTNIFAMQAMLFISVGLMITFREADLFRSAAFGLGFFIALHPSYAFNYMRQRFMHSKVYATKLAKVFILKFRPSIWKDLILDIWVLLIKSPKSALLYAYQNAVLVVLILNPIAVMTLLTVYDKNLTGFALFSWHIFVLGCLIFFATSFRKTRFLGEPERYIELVTPFAFIALVSVSISEQKTGEYPFIALLIYSALITALQVFYSFVVHKRSEFNGLTKEDLIEITDIIEKSRTTDPNIRMICNNQNWIYTLLNTNWSFVIYYPSQETIAGLDHSEFIENHPYFSDSAIERFINSFNINIYIRDLSHSSNKSLHGTGSAKVLYQNKKMEIVQYLNASPSESNQPKPDYKQ